MSASFRCFTPRDRRDCVHVFCSNVPRYFREHERLDFEDFLDSAEVSYFVLEIERAVVGCGGYGVREQSKMADLCWGMIAQPLHGRRLGELLLVGRLEQIITREHVEGVRLATSQHTDGFFGRYGFCIQHRRRNGLAEGLDEVEMRLDLTPRVRQNIHQCWNELATVE